MYKKESAYKINANKGGRTWMKKNKWLDHIIGDAVVRFLYGNSS
ncbi:hypothetical protein ACEQPO_01975 [Bacillus sp. SL00103]